MLTDGASNRQRIVVRVAPLVALPELGAATREHPTEAAEDAGHRTDRRLSSHERLLMR